MFCILCGRVADYHPGGFCSECVELLKRNNERVMFLAILTEAAEFCPVHLRERIEKILDTIKPPFTTQIKC